MQAGWGDDETASKYGGSNTASVTTNSFSFTAHNSDWQQFGYHSLAGVNLTNTYDYGYCPS